VKKPRVPPTILPFLPFFHSNGRFGALFFMSRISKTRFLAKKSSKWVIFEKSEKTKGPPYDFAIFGPFLTQNAHFDDFFEEFFGKKCSKTPILKYLGKNQGSPLRFCHFHYFSPFLTIFGHFQSFLYRTKPTALYIKLIFFTKKSLFLTI